MVLVGNIKDTEIHTHLEADITDLDHTDSEAIHTDEANEITALADKASPVSADVLIIEDSAAANIKKKVEIGNLPGGGGGGQTDTVIGSSGITNVGDNVDADLAPTYGSSSNTICEGDDSRLSDARNPNAHASDHENGGSDEISVVDLSGLLADDQHVLDAEVTTVVEATKLDDLAPCDDNTDLDGSAAKHGLMPKATQSKVDGIAVGADVTGDNTCDTPGGAGTDLTALHDNVANEITAITEKTSVVDADELIIEDSADSFNKKSITVVNFQKAVSDGDAIHNNIAGEIDAITNKATPVNADRLLIEDSADSFNKKEIQIGDLPAPSVDFKPEVFIDTVGNQAITGTPAVVPLNSAVFTEANYTNTAGTITVNSDGIYEIHWGICYNITNTSGGTRGMVSGYIENDVGGWSITPGSYGGVYHREAAGGSGCSGSTIISLSNGDNIRLVHDRINGSTNIDTRANEVTMQIKKIG